MCTKIIFLFATLCVVNTLEVTIKAYVDDMERYADSEDNLSVYSCNNQECDQRCRRLQFPGGICVNGRCKCDNFLNSKDIASILKEYLLLQKCYAQECDQRCYDHHFAGGFCVNGRCYCYRYPNLEVKGSSVEDIFNNDENEFENDNLISYRIAEDTVIDNKVDGYNPANSLNQYKCKPEFCDHLCHFLSFDSGSCVNNSCICNKKN